MDIVELIQNNGKCGFSFEVLPPLKGKGIVQIYNAIDKLNEFDPLYINITTHRSEYVFKSNDDGTYQRVSERSRPGTVAVAAAIQQKYGIPAVPHIICSGFSKVETEYALIDLNFLGINNLLLLRGDKAKHENRFVPNENGHAHASEWQEQVNNFNNGYFIDGTKMDIMTDSRFSYGVAGYPEKHEESPNMEQDLYWLKKKVEAGADYVVTQMFYDNQKYVAFVERARKEGINVPIVPGIKPFSKLSQLSVIPKTFNVDLPQELVVEAIKCKDDKEARALGIEWCVNQCRELIAYGVPGIHFYTVGAVENVKEVAAAVY